MNRKFYRFLIMSICLVAAAMVSSCVNKDYVIDDLDKGIHLAPNGIDLPLVTIGHKTLRDILGDRNNLVVNDGYYAMRYENNFSFSVKTADISIPSVGNIGNAFGDMPLDIDIPSFDFSGETDIRGLDLSREGDLPFSGTVTAQTPPITGTIVSYGGKIEIDFGLPEEVEKIKTVQLGPDAKGTPVTVTFDLGELQKANNGVTITSLVVDMPARYKLAYPSVDGTIGPGTDGGLANRLSIMDYPMGASQTSRITFYIESLTLGDKTPAAVTPAPADPPYEITFTEDFEYRLSYSITPKQGGLVDANGQKPKVTLTGAPEFRDAEFTAKAIEFKLDHPAEKSLDYRVTGIPSTIEKVLSVDFVDAGNHIVITVDDLGLPYALADQPEIKITFPAALSLADPKGNLAGNVLTAPFADFVDGYTLRLDKIEFGDDGTPSGGVIDMDALGYAITAEVDHTFPSRDFTWSKDIDGRNVPSSVNVNVDASGLTVASVHVELDFDFEQYIGGKLDPIDLSDLTDEFGDGNPDLLAPTIVMEVTNSAGITVAGDLTLTPRGKSGETLSTVEVNGLNINPSNSGGAEKTYIFIAGDGTTPPSGYEPYYPQNFRSLFSTIPTTIDIDLSARAATGKVHTIPITGTDLPFSLNYMVDMPLAFGGGMDMAIVITENGLNDTFSDLAEMNVKAADITINVGLEVSFPLKTGEIGVELQTRDGGTVPGLVTTVEGTIEGPVQGLATSRRTAFSIKMKAPDGGDFRTLSEIDKLMLTLPVSGTGTENRLSPDDYIKGNAWISLPNGINADLDEL